MRDARAVCLLASALILPLLSVTASPPEARATELEGPLLYATTHGEDGGSQLWWIDPVALTYGLIGDTGHDAIGAIAREAATGKLWGVGRPDGSEEEWIFEIDTETGAAEPTLPLSVADGESMGLSPRHAGKGFPGVLTRDATEVWRLRRNGKMVLTDTLPVLEQAGGGGVTHRPGRRAVHWTFEYGGAHKLRRGHVVASLPFTYAADAAGTDTFTATGAATCDGTMYLLVRDDLAPGTSSLSTFAPAAGGDIHVMDFDVAFDGLSC